MSLKITEESAQFDHESAGYKRRWVAVIALGLSLFLSALDATIVALALPVLAEHFELSDSIVAAVMLAYAIPVTLLILPSGGIVNRFHSLPVFLLSVLGFGAGSVLCSFAPSFLFLLGGRLIQGTFAALIGTQGFALAAAVMLPKERGKAMGLLGTIAPLGGVAGPGIGGVLLNTFGWSSIFLVNLPVIAVAAVLGILSLRGMRLANNKGRVGSVFGQMLGLMRKRQFSFGLVAFFFSVSASVALYYLLPFDLQGVQHVSPVGSGSLLLCIPLGMMMMGALGGYLADRYPPRPLIFAGAGLLLAGMAALSLVANSQTTVLDLAWRLLLIGAGIGLFSSPNQTVIMSLGGREAMGAASALSNLAARLGNVVAPLILGVVWSFFADFPLQIEAGTLAADALAILMFFLVSLSALAKISVQKHGAA